MPASPSRVSALPNGVEPSKVAEPEGQLPLREGPVASALSLSMQSQSALLSAGQEDGVLATRSMTSSRGGSRRSDPVPAPSVSPTAVANPNPQSKKEPLKPQTYKVNAGDTLSGIAAAFGVTPETVLWANDLGNGELLQIGDTLTIPPVSGVLHTVKKGDTLSGIAGAYGADAAKIAEANALSDTNALAEGQLLIVPGGMKRTTEPITGLPTAPSQQELAKAPKYVVKDGDTLLSIADSFGVRASVIQVANNLLNPDMLKIGLELSIPGGTAQTSAATQAPKPAAASAPAKPAPAPAPAPEPAQPVSGNAGARIAAIAQQYLGYRYLWGGHSPSSGFDCSGFTWYVYKEAGINIPMHDLAGQLNAGPRISRENLLPGDLVFFQNTYKPGLSHSGLYIGGGRFINAETEAVGVQIRSLSDPYWAPRYVGASRPW